VAEGKGCADGCDRLKPTGFGVQASSMMIESHEADYESTVFTETSGRGAWLKGEMNGVYVGVDKCK